VLYLSLVAAGRDFLSFQWDVLLLEAGFLAIFLGPWRLWSGRLAPAAPPALALFLLWWLVFRLTFQSGVVKLSWGDPTWRGLTALDYHFYTQPLPTWTAWYVHQLPAWLKKLQVVATFGLEIAVPFLFFGPRPLRLLAVAGTVFFQLAIFGTGNYNFFNLLTIALVLLLVDDAAWRALLPDTLLARLPSPFPPGAAAAGVVRMGLTVAVAAVFLVLGAVRGHLKGIGDFTQGNDDCHSKMSFLAQRPIDKHHQHGCADSEIVRHHTAPCKKRTRRQSVE